MYKKNDQSSRGNTAQISLCDYRATDRRCSWCSYFEAIREYRDRARLRFRFHFLYVILRMLIAALDFALGLFDLRLHFPLDLFLGRFSLALDLPGRTKDDIPINATPDTVIIMAFFIKALRM